MANNNTSETNYHVIEESLDEQGYPQYRAEVLVKTMVPMDEKQGQRLSALELTAIDRYEKFEAPEVSLTRSGTLTCPWIKDWRDQCAAETSKAAKTGSRPDIMPECPCDHCSLVLVVQDDEVLSCGACPYKTDELSKLAFMARR